MKKIFKPINAFLMLSLLAASCKKEPPIPPDSSKELKIVGWDSSSKYGGYISCGVAGTVDANGLAYNFVAPSSNGAITITYMKFHINVNDGSKPITMFSVWDNYSLIHDVLVTGSDVEFKDMKTVIPEGDNGRWVGANLTYAGIGRNGVVSGKTVSSVSLMEVRYTDQSGLKKTIYPKLKTADQMSVFSYVWLNGNYPQYSSGLSVGTNRVFNQGFDSQGGDNLLEEIPLYLKAVNCVIGNVPHISIDVWEENKTIFTSMQVPVSMANDSTAILKLPTPYLLKKDHTVFIDFYVDVQSVTTAPATILRAGIGRLKYFKYKELATGVEFSSSNELFMWPYGNYGNPYSYLDNVWELTP